MADTDDEYSLSRLNDELTDEYVPVLVTFSVVLVLGIIGNTLSIVLYGYKEKKKEQRNVTYFLLSVLSTNDLVACASECTVFYEMTNTVTFRSQTGCIVMYFFNYGLVLNSLTLLFVIAVDRHRRVCCDNSKWQLNFSTARKCVACTAIYSAGVSLKNYFIVDTSHIDLDAGNFTNIIGFYCSHSYQEHLQTTIFIFHVIDFIVLITMTLTMLILYKSIIQKIVHAEKQLKMNYYSGQRPLTGQNASGNKTGQRLTKAQPAMCNGGSNTTNISCLTNTSTLSSIKQLAITDIKLHELHSVEFQIRSESTTYISRIPELTEERRIADTGNTQHSDNAANATTHTVQQTRVKHTKATTVSISAKRTNTRTEYTKAHEHWELSQKTKHATYNSTKAHEHTKIAAEKSIAIMMAAVTIATILPFAPYFYVCFFYQT